MRDDGRRTVQGSDTIVAHHQEFQAFAELDRGWYVPGDPVVIEINMRSPNETPVTATGTAALIRLEERNGDASASAEQVQAWEIAAGTDGRQTLRINAPRAGRYQIEFRTRDSWDREVSAVVEFWVYDHSADFNRSPWPALQIIPDRRTYRVGETARLLVIAAAPDTYLLFCQGLDEPRFLRVTDHVQVLDVPITEREVPNLFLEGTLVWDGVVRTETCQLFVPPVHELLKVELAAEQPLQKPGESGKFKLKVTDFEGRPVSGDLALTAFDKAVTYIQPESAIGPKSFLIDRKWGKWHGTLGVLSTLNRRRFESSGEFMCPEFYLTDDYVPQIGAMGGGLPDWGDPGDVDGSGS